MGRKGRLTINKRAFSAKVTEIVDTELMRRARAIADACNSEAGLGDQGYIAGTDGDPSKTLRKNDYRATVITATEAAKLDNAEHNRLVRNLYAGEG